EIPAVERQIALDVELLGDIAEDRIGGPGDSAGMGQRPDERSQQHRLACAIRTDDGQATRLGQIERDTPDDVRTPEAHRQILDLQRVAKLLHRSTRPTLFRAAPAAARSSVRESSKVATQAHDITATGCACEQLLACPRHFLQANDRAHDEPLDLARLPLAGELLPQGELPGSRYLDGVYAEKAHAPQDERHDRDVERRRLREA